ncbi:MAG: hypothetical protein AAGG06_17305 [Pseudomonadota bacterium]
MKDITTIVIAAGAAIFGLLIGGQHSGYEIAAAQKQSKQIGDLEENMAAQIAALSEEMRGQMGALSAAVDAEMADLSASVDTKLDAVSGTVSAASSGGDEVAGRLATIANALGAQDSRLLALDERVASLSAGIAALGEQAKAVAAAAPAGAANAPAPAPEVTTAAAAVPAAAPSSGVVTDLVLSVGQTGLVKDQRVFLSRLVAEDEEAHLVLVGSGKATVGKWTGPAQLGNGCSLSFVGIEGRKLHLKSGC